MRMSAPPRMKKIRMMKKKNDKQGKTREEII